MVMIEPPPAASISGSAEPGARDQRIGGHVEREPETVARRVREAALEVAGVREGDRVDEQVELAAERLGDLARRPVEVLVGADVARA